MWHVTWALEAMCSQYSFKLLKWLMSFVTYRCFVSCIVFFVCFFTKIQCNICVNTDQFSSITEWHITYRYMTVRNSCQQLCSEVSDSDSKMSSLFLGTSCECLHPWNYTSLFTSTTGDRRYAEWHPSIPNCLWNPHTQPIPTTSRFPPPSTYTEPSLTPLHLPGLTSLSLGPLGTTLNSHWPGEFELGLMELQRWAFAVQWALALLPGIRDIFPYNAFNW